MNTDKPTNFFARQEAARRNCRNYLIGFCAAVLVIIVVTTMALRFVWYLYLHFQAVSTINFAESRVYMQKVDGFSLFDPASFILVAFVLTAIIGAASLYKLHALRQGGPAVAELLGGELVSPDSTDPARRRLLNIVEEMSIASGIPMPKVYVLAREYNINAFAAGLTFNDAVVGITGGGLERLSRDELQGVIAHEFSHILNGDMRLNVQLIGILFGILFLGISGRKFLSGSRFTLRVGLPAIATGVLLTVIGYLGTFLGRALQAAISRHKERLADASAVQFTRNPLGLSGALKKIGGATFGSNIRSHDARQASHLFFGESHPDNLFPFLATHPPLKERILLLEPSFDGVFPSWRDDRIKPKDAYVAASSISTLNIPIRAPRLGGGSAAEVVGAVGNPSAENIVQGQVFLDALPIGLHKAMQTPAGASATIFALLLEPDASRKRVQVEALRRALTLQGDTDQVVRIAAEMAGLSRECRLPLIEMAMPALSRLNSLEKRNFLLILNALINVDGRISLFELSVQWILNRYINPEEALFRSITKFTFAQAGMDAVVLISALATAGHAGDIEKTQRAFEAGIARIPELAARRPVLLSQEIDSYMRVNRALTNLTSASFKIRQTVIDACAHCAFADKIVTADERELLRVIALALECPLPPFITAENPTR